MLDIQTPVNLDIQTPVKTDGHASGEPETLVVDLRGDGKFSRRRFSQSSQGNPCPLGEALRKLAHHGALRAKTRDSTSCPDAASRTAKVRAVAHIRSEPDPEVVSVLRPRGEGSIRFGGERRIFPRRASCCHVTICRMEDATDSSAYRLAWKMHSSRTRARLVDISQGGLSFLSWQPLRIGEQLRLRITNPLYDRSIVIVGDVLRQERARDGNWLAVCCFQESLAYQQVNFFGSHLFSTKVV